LSFRAAASVTHVRLSTPFHDRFNATSFVFTYVHSGQTHLAYEHLGLMLAIQRYRAFQVAAMRVWNALLTSIRASSSYLQGVSTSTEKNVCPMHPSMTEYDARQTSMKTPDNYFYHARAAFTRQVSVQSLYIRSHDVTYLW